MAIVLALVLEQRGLASDYALPPVTNLTLVEVHDGHYLPRYGIGSAVVITNATQLHRIAEFISTRTNQWEIPWSGVPVPKVVAELHTDTGMRLGRFGAGKGFFQWSARGDWFSRRASREEVEEFLRLLQVPLDSIDSGVNKPKPANKTVEATQPRLEDSDDQ